MSPCYTYIKYLPPFSLPRDGIHSFHIGLHHGHVKISSTENYFVSEGVSVAPEELQEAKEVRLLVTPLAPDTQQRVAEFLSQGGSESESEVPAILDICLDFFSTQNPFLDLYAKSNLYEQLKELYTFEPVPPSLPEEERRRQSYALSDRRRRLLQGGRKEGRRRRCFSSLVLLLS